MYVLSGCVFQYMLTEGIRLNTHALFLSAERSAYVETNTYNLFLSALLANCIAKRVFLRTHSLRFRQLESVVVPIR